MPFGARKLIDSQLQDNISWGITMNESLVRWTLLNNLEFLSKSLDFPIASKKGQEVSSEYGRIDFILEDFKRREAHSRTRNATGQQEQTRSVLCASFEL